MASLSVIELAAILKQHGVAHDPSWWNKCAKLYTWQRDGLLPKIEEFAVANDITPSNGYEPYRTVELGAAYFARNPSPSKSSKSVPIKQILLDYVDNAATPIRMRWLLGDVQNQIKALPDQEFDQILTSPPYWGKRNYGHEKQIGLEPTF